MKYINALKRFDKMIIKENNRLYKVYSSILKECDEVKEDQEEIETIEDTEVVDTEKCADCDTIKGDVSVSDNKKFGETEEETTEVTKLEETSEVEEVKEAETVEESNEQIEEASDDENWISAKEFFKMENESEFIDDEEVIGEEEDNATAEVIEDEEDATEEEIEDKEDATEEEIEDKEDATEEEIEGEVEAEFEEVAEESVDAETFFGV
jgi:hypothetical protein